LECIRNFPCSIEWTRTAFAVPTLNGRATAAQALFSFVSESDLVPCDWLLSPANTSQGDLSKSLDDNKITIYVCLPQ
jgi:hypothetical protein